ncbi:transposase [Psychromonas hadalis]|uniref:transposase n=1 Tax=Psychromonas hadalis TaxID=211669 RepID=UPI0003B75D8B|nr:transposase [Psychromonas hadalis]
MSRLVRVCPVGMPQHIIQRGNNHHACFVDHLDFTTYTNWLKEYSVQFSVEIHAWVFMTNHVHLLCTPQQENGISNMMQALGRQYVRYFNNKYQRTGTLWEGRFKSCLIEADSYLLQVYRYIELNPVRAKMVDFPEQYHWSSFQINALGKLSDLCKPHPLYLLLGDNVRERQFAYQELFQQPLTEQLIDDIRCNLNSNLAIGSEPFKEVVEALTGRKLHHEKIGRPKVGSDQT